MNKQKGEGKPHKTRKDSIMVKSFRYTNSLGIPKKLVVNEPNIEGKYPVMLWEMIHGNLCGSGTMTKDELNDYLEHFGIKERF